MTYQLTKLLPLVSVGMIVVGCGSPKPVGMIRHSGKSHLQSHSVTSPPPLSLPSSPVVTSSGPFQAGGLNTATKWLGRHDHTVAASIPVQDGHVLLTQQPGWALYVDTASNKWVGLPLRLAVISFERETKSGGLLFLLRGPVDDGNAMPFPYQVFCMPETSPESAFVCQEGPKFYPVSASTNFGSKPHAILDSITAMPDGIEVGFEPQPNYSSEFFADYTSAPPTQVNYDASSRTLVLHFTLTKLGNIDNLDAVKNGYVQRVSAIQTSTGVDVKTTLFSSAGYYSGNIVVDNGTQLPFFQLFLTNKPPIAPWGP